MRKNKQLRLVLGSLFLVSIVALMLIVLTASLSSANTISPVQQPGSNAVVATVATTSVVATVATTSVVATITPSPIISPSATAQITPTEVAVGQAYIKPYSQFPARVEVIRVAQPPLITQETAILALYNRLGKPDWVLGKSILNGKPITVSATYGLVTQGEGRDGIWAGDVNIPVQICTIDAKCTATGQVLDHIENRLMWVLDYSNIIQQAAGPSFTPTNCKGATSCTAQPETSHSVYLVDATNLQVMDKTSY